MIVCPRSSSTPSEGEWDGRAHDRTTCGDCGSAVRIYQRRLDIGGNVRTNTLLADHEVAESPPPHSGSNPDARERVLGAAHSADEGERA